LSERLPPWAGRLLLGAAGVLSLACLVDWVRFGFRWVLAWWLALGLIAATSAWTLVGGQKKRD
jgi:hypothetical protein